MTLQSAADDALAPGSRLGAASVEALLSRSDTGFVYHVIDPLLMGKVAVKEYFPTELCERGPSGEMRLRPGADEALVAAGRSAFAEESRLLSQGDLPGLLRVNLAFEENGTVYRMMPLHEAPSLTDALRAGAFKGDAGAVRALLAPLLKTLGALHQQGLVHGHLHPAQVMLPARDAPLLLGFGLARQALHLAPDHRYAPLEQSKMGGHLPRGAWTDLYSLGAIGYHAAVGEPPPSAVDRAAGEAGDLRLALDRALGGRRGGTDPASTLAAALDRALAVLPSDRPQTAEALEDALIGRAPAPPAPPAPRKRDASSRTRRPEPALAWTADREPAREREAAPPEASPSPQTAPAGPQALPEPQFAALPPPQASARPAPVERPLPDFLGTARSAPRARPSDGAWGRDPLRDGRRAEPAFEPPGFDRLADREAELRWAGAPQPLAPRRAPTGLVAALWICTLLLAAIGGAAGWHWYADREPAQALRADEVPALAGGASPSAGARAVPARPGQEAAALGSGTVRESAGSGPAGQAALPSPGGAATPAPAATAAPPGQPGPQAAAQAAAPGGVAQNAAPVVPPPAQAGAQPNGQRNGAAPPQDVAAPQAGAAAQAPRSQVAPVVIAPGQDPPRGADGPPRGADGPPRVAEGPATPREACGGRTNFSLHWCMQQQCAQPRFSGHSQCRIFRATGEVR